MSDLTERLRDCAHALNDNLMPTHAGWAFAAVARIEETDRTITRVVQQLRERAQVLADWHGQHGSAADLWRLADELDGLGGTS